MVEHDIFDNITRFIGTTPSEFNSEQFYNKLHQDHVNLRVYSSECARLITPYKGTYKYSLLRRTCAQVVKYLKTTYTKLKKEELKYNHCILLNYWIYSRLVNIFHTENSSVIAPALGEFELIWNDIVDKSPDKTLYNKCKPDNTIVRQKDWRQRKALYDYCVNYDALKLTLEFFKDKCKDYWTYVDSHTSIYEYFEKLCSEENDQCPKFYDQCQKYDPKHVLPTFVCNEQMMKKKAENTAANARSTLPAGMPAGQEASSGMSNSSDISSGGLQSPHNGTHPAKKTGDILLGVVATFLASGALYRFTPLGNMLRNGFGRNNNNMRNMHGGEYALFDYASESFNPYAGGGEEHYIGYHPA